MAASVPTQSATPARVATSTSVATLLAASGSRKMVIISNESAAILYVKYGTAASITDYTYAVAANANLELASPIYGGVLTGILSTGTGNAQVTAY